MISEEQWFAARQASSTLIQQALQGLHYLQTYDRSLIRGIVSAAYMGWTAYAILHILRHSDHHSLRGGKPASFSTFTTPLVTVASWLVLLAFWTLFALQHSPLSFYVYIMFPCYFWWRVLEELGTAISDGTYRRAASGMVGGSNKKSYFVTIVIKVVVVILALQGMVVRYSLIYMENVDVRLGWLHLQVYLEHRVCSNRRDMAIILERSSSFGSFLDNLREMGYVMPCHCGISAALGR